MGAARCHGCAEQILDYGEGRRCNFCCRWFHPQCSLSTASATSRGEYICNFGCYQAYQAGKRDANSKRLTLKCGQCGETFSSRSNLRTHVDAVHAGKRYGPCPACSADFASKQKLREHLERCRKRTITELTMLQNSNGSSQGDPPSLALKQAVSAILVANSNRAAATSCTH